MAALTLVKPANLLPKFGLFRIYEDGLAPFYEKKFEFLFDYNLELLNWILKQIKANPTIEFTAEFTKEVAQKDFRNQFGKKDIHKVETKSYFQVFSDRNEFIPT